MSVAGNDQIDSWKEKFEEICAQTQIAPSLSKAELNKLIEDTGKLIDYLSEIKDPWVKVYIFRLEKCRDFFKFTLEWQAMESENDTS